MLRSCRRIFIISGPVSQKPFAHGTESSIEILKRLPIVFRRVYFSVTKMWLVWQLSVCCITNNMTVYKHVNSRWARDDSHSCGWAHPFSNWLTMCYISIISTEYLRFVANKLLLSRCFTSTETIRLIRDGRRWGKREIIYMLLHCHHQNVSCIKTGSDESHFNVSLIVRDKVTRQYPH